MRAAPQAESVAGAGRPTEIGMIPGTARVRVSSPMKDVGTYGAERFRLRTLS